MGLIKIDENEPEVNIAEDDLEELKTFLNNYKIKKMPNIVKWYKTKANNLKEKYRIKQCKERGIIYDPDNIERKTKGNKNKKNNYT